MAHSEALIYNLVYDYYETRILMGAVRCGEYLPSIPKIAEGFQMAPRTVRAALTRLEEKGYIEVRSRKPPRVIYEVSAGRVRENAALYFIPRQAGLKDFFRSGKLLTEPVWEYAQSRLSKETWEQLKQRLAADGKMDLPVSTRLHIYVFAALENKLIMNFYWELLRYIRFPYLAPSDAHSSRDRELLGERKEHEKEFMRNAFEGDFETAMNRLLTFCSRTRELYGTKQADPVPFRWNVYWHRPQLCYTMVSRIISGIIKGTYSPGTYLPSMPVMSEQLDISYRTLRRTLSILGSLGIIELHQGRTSLVCTQIGAIDFDRMEVREIFRLYQESLQFMALTVGPVILYTLRNVEKEDRDCLTEEFADMISRNTCRRCCGLITDFIVEKCPLATVRECYGRLSEFLVWGYSFTLYNISGNQLQEEYAPVTRQAAEYLKNRQWEEFADHWKKMMEHEQCKAELFLSRHKR